jgi:hypothetical protein
MLMFLLDQNGLNSCGVAIHSKHSPGGACTAEFAHVFLVLR